MIERFGFDAGSQVVEIASNDGYLLQYFIERGVPVLGVEPAANVAAAAVGQGHPDRGRVPRHRDRPAPRRRAWDAADLLVGNNVLAHVPNLNDFVAGLKTMLAPDGVLTMEFPHLLRADREQPVRHHLPRALRYFSFSTVERIFAHHGITLFDVEELPTHGGSPQDLRRPHREPGSCHDPTGRELHEGHREAGGSARIETYLNFGER